MASPTSDALGLCVTYCKTSYGYARVCYDLPLDGVRFAPARALPIRRLRPRSEFWNATRLFFPPHRELVHTFNDLVMGARAWVVSHELELPRFLGTAPASHWEKAFTLLAKDGCRRILPMSDASRNWFLRRVPDALRDRLAAKTEVFTGGVNGPEHYGFHGADDATGPEPARPARRAARDPLRLVFVGNNAFRKGGQFVLDAFDRLRGAGLNTELTFIGKVDPFSYVLPVSADDHARLVGRLKTTPGVTWIPRADNRDVLATMAGAHVGLLPTLDDSLGWSVIEMMAAGLPVVASNIVALPELIADGETGELIELPLDADRRWAGVTTSRGDAAVAADAGERLVTGLVRAVTRLANDESRRVALGQAGRSRYLAEFTPELAARRLGNIYRKALEG
jgi:glycosyltransferase involved in cell wall biosynthesis